MLNPLNNDIICKVKNTKDITEVGGCVQVLQKREGKRLGRYPSGMSISCMVTCCCCITRGVQWVPGLCP